MHYEMRISDQKHHAAESARIKRERQRTHNELIIEQARKLRLDNVARTLELIERAKAAGVDPAIIKKIAELR